MLFSSIGFLAGFLPAAVALVWAGARLAGPRGASVALLGCSLVFYGWAHPPYLALITASIGANYLLGRAIGRTGSRGLVALGVALNLAALGWFKYAGLFASALADLAALDITLDGVVLPLAISFFTFQQIAYLVDARTRGTGRTGFLDYALFVAFFPQLIAGPIVHHRDVVPQFAGPGFARFERSDVAFGLALFSIGLAKKVLIADGLAPLADGAFAASAAGEPLASADAWAGVLAYSFQIYFDFSGYSDMALGLARIFGVRLPMNFNSPYKARSIVEFWRRWHITLSRFLRDYLYIPLGGNRRGGLARYRNLFIVMLLGGLWHGAAWTFVVWGGIHAVALIAERAIAARWRP
ncbi:MAG: MBOAT family protein, partial [Caulobacterales bacterium]|nr:MBOAT family protein [Caulobacterales bacterium]